MEGRPQGIRQVYGYETWEILDAYYSKLAYLQSELISNSAELSTQLQVHKDF